MQQIKVSELRPHPRNNEFFDDMSGEKWEEFLESVRTSGVIEPIVVTTDMIIVSGHQRVRACKELGIESVMCEIKSYKDDDSIIKDLLETNIRQRGDVGGSAKKVGIRIKELERLYGVKHGNNQNSTSNNYKSQEDIAKDFGISIPQLQNYKKLTEMIPELEELVDTKTVTPTTALAIMRSLSEEEQLQLISSMDTTKKITQKEVQKYIDENGELEIVVKQLKERKPEIQVVDNTDYSSISNLENEIKDLKMQKNMLERKVKLNQEDSDKYNKLKSDIDFLSKKKSDLGRQIDSATELSGLTVRLQKLLEEELAPIKFKRCIEVLDSSDVCVSNLQDIISKIDNWSFEMKNLLTNKYDDVVDVQ